MKKIVIIIALIFSFPLIGCSVSNKKDGLNENNKTQMLMDSKGIINNEKSKENKSNIINKNTLKKDEEKFKGSNKNNLNKNNNIKSEKAFIKKEYSYNKGGKQIKLKYPQITSSIREQKKVNKLILDTILKQLKDYTDNNKNYTITLDYIITLNTNNVLSIKYNGVFYSKGLPYPTNLCYATNIDLVNAKKFTLKDIVKVDNVFLKSLKSKGTIINKNVPKELLQAQEEILKNYSVKELEDLNVYLTSNSIVVIIPLPHAIGDYMNVTKPSSIL